MRDIQYIMVSDWDYHWDCLLTKKGHAHFSGNAIKFKRHSEKYPDQVLTLFIKREKHTGIFERSWLGYAKNFEESTAHGKRVVRFDVTDLKEFLCPLIFTSYPNGWYENNSKVIFSFDNADAEQLDAEHSLPPFCRDMATCDWLSFELNCFFLLRLLGIHDIRKVPQEHNSGMPDGYFQINDLAVIYDATIMDNFLITKEKQIQLYVRQFKENRFLFNDTCSEKQVWIITRNPACRLIDTIDGIQVKEIPFQELVKVFIHRLDNEVDSTMLATILKNFGTENYTYNKDGVKYRGYERHLVFNDLGLDSDFDLIELLD